MTSVRVREERLGRALLLALAVSCAAALVVHGYLGLSNRYLADDYCFVSNARIRGFVAAQLHWYSAWRGDVSHSLVISLLGLAGPRLVSYLPAMILGLWFAALAWTAAQFALIVRIRSPVVTSMAFAALILYATVYGAPNVIQSLYWLSGMLSYTAPLILLTFFAGTVAYLARRSAGRRPSPSAIIFCGGLALIAGGFSEVYITVQTGLLVAALLLCQRVASLEVKRTTLSLLLGGLAGSLLAGGILVLSPGNAVRQALFPQPPLPLVVAPLLSPVWGLFVLAGFVLFSGILFAVLAVGCTNLTADLAPPDRQLASRAASLMVDRRRVRWWIGVSLAAPSALASIPALYGMFAGPSTRAQIVPLFVTAILVAFWSIAAGLTRQKAATQKVMPLVALGLLILVPWASAVAALSFAGDLRAYAAKWDIRDRGMREAAARGERNLIAPALGYTGRLEDLGPDPNHWLNQCIARYYGVDSVKAEERHDNDFPWWFQSR